MEQGMTLDPNYKHELGCFVDNDFAGNYNSYHDQDTTSNKSYTRYSILYQGCAMLSTSKLQTQCGPSSMESEYQALSQSMRDILPLREILKEVLALVLNQDKLMPKCSANSKEFSDITSEAVDSPIPKLKIYKDNHTCLKFA